MNNLLGLLIFSLLLITACTEDCCHDGSIISPDEIQEVIDLNEDSSDLFSSTISGNISCVNNNPLMNVRADLVDSSGNVFTLSTNDQGFFVEKTLLAGPYTLRFTDPPLYEYSQQEYDSLINDLNDIILGEREATTSDMIAYHMVNLEDGLTTLDRIFFEKLQNGENQIADFSPWRYVTREDYNLGIINLLSEIPVTVMSNQELRIDVIRIYVGDPMGVICN